MENINPDTPNQLTLSDIIPKTNTPATSIKPSSELSFNDIKGSVIKGPTQVKGPDGFYNTDVSDYEKYNKGGVYQSSYMDEQRARNQGAGEQLLHGLVKMGGTAASTFAETFTDAIAGIGYLFNKGNDIASGSNNAKFSDVYDNVADKFFDKINNNLEKAFPNYYTQKEQDASILSNMFGYGAGNWWGDKFIKNIGFTAGAIGAGIVTAGFGDWALGISRASKVAAALIEGEKTLENANQLYKAGSITKDTLQAFNNSYKYVKAANKVNAFVSVFASASTEAYIEGRNGLDDYVKGKTDNYKSIYGKDPDAETAAKFQEEGETLGNIRVGLNIAILMPSNFIQFGKLFSRGFSKDTLQLAEKDFIDKTTGKTIENLTDKELLNSTLTYVKPKYSSVIKALKSPLTEGFQEIEQYHIERTMQNYYDKKYNYEGREQASDFMEAMGKGFAEAYGTKEGLEQAVIGALTGAIGMPNIKGISNRIKGYEGDKSIMAGGVWEGIFEAAHEAAKGSAIAEQLNSKDHLIRTIQQFDNFASFNNNQKDYDKAIKDGDHFMAENSKYDDLANHVIGQLESDSYDLYQAKVKALRNLSNDEFKALGGFKELTPEKRVAIIDSMLFKAETIKNYWDKTNVRFNDINALGKIDQEHAIDIRQMFVKSAGLIDDINKRESDIGNKISKLTNGQLNYTDIQNIRGKYTDTDNLTRSLLNSIDDDSIKKQAGNIINNAIKSFKAKGGTLTGDEVTNEVRKQAKDTVTDTVLNRIINTTQNIVNRENEQGEFRKVAQQKIKELRATNPQVADEVDALLADVSRIKDRRKEFVDFYNFLDKGIQSDTVEHLAKHVAAVKTEVVNKQYDAHTENIAKQKEQEIKDAEKAKQDATNEKTINDNVAKETNPIKKVVNATKQVIKNSKPTSNTPKPKGPQVSVGDIFDKIEKHEPIEGGHALILQDYLHSNYAENTKIIDSNHGKVLVSTDTKEGKQEDIDYLYDKLNHLDNYNSKDKNDASNMARLNIESAIKNLERVSTEDEIKQQDKEENKGKIVEQVDSDIADLFEHLSPIEEESESDKKRKEINKLIDIFDKLDKQIDTKNFLEVANYLNNLIPLGFKEKYDKFRRLYNTVKDQDIVTKYDDVIKALTQTAEPKVINVEPSLERNRGIIKLVGKTNKIVAGVEEEDEDYERNYARSEVGHNLIAYLSRAYMQINDAFNKSKLRLDLDNKLLNHEPALDPNYLKEDTDITLRMQSSLDFESITDKNGDIKTFDDLARNEDGTLNIDMVPIVIEKDGHKIGYLHTVDWINSDSIQGSSQHIKAEKEKLRAMRDYIVNNGTVKTKITSVENGYLIKQANNGVSKVNKAFKNPKIKIAIGKDGNFKVNNTRNFNQDETKNVLNLDKKDGTSIIEGATYLMLHLRNNDYVGVPVTNGKLQSNAVKSISSAIQAFLTNNDVVLNELGKQGFNVKGSVRELERFVEQFVYNFDNINKIEEGKTLHDYLNTKDDIKEARIQITNYGISFGQALGLNQYEFKFDKDNNLSAVKADGKYYKKDHSQFSSKYNDAIKSLETQLGMMYSKVSTDLLDGNKPIIGIEDNKATALYPNYKDYITDNTNTSLQDMEYTNPITGRTMYINSIQGKVTIDTSFSTKKEDEVIEEVKPIITESSNTTVVNPLGIIQNINDIDLGDENYSLIESEASPLLNYLPSGGTEQVETTESNDNKPSSIHDDLTFIKYKEAIDNAKYVRLGCNL